MPDRIRPTPSSLLGEPAFTRRCLGLVLAVYCGETPDEVRAALRALSEELGVEPRRETVRAALHRLRELEAGR